MPKPRRHSPSVMRMPSREALRKMLAAEPAQLARGLARHLATYATGAATSGLDQRAIEAIVAESAKQDHGVRAVVHALVQSELFRTK